MRRALAGLGATAADAALLRAAQSGDERAVRVALRDGARVACVDSATGASPLHLAARHTDTAALASLIYAGAPLDPRTREEQLTPLLEAARDGRSAAVSMLLFHGADAAAVGGDGMTALSLAEKNGHEKCVQALKSAAENDAVNAADAPDVVVSYCISDFDAFDMRRDPKKQRVSTLEKDQERQEKTEETLFEKRGGLPSFTYASSIPSNSPVDELEAELRARGYAVSVCRDIKGPWTAGQRAHVRNCGAVVAVCSPAYAETPWTHQELAFAVAQSKPVVAVWHSGEYPPRNAAHLLAAAERVPSDCAEGYANMGLPHDAVAAQVADALVKQGVLPSWKFGRWRLGGEVMPSDLKVLLSSPSLSSYSSVLHDKVGITSLEEIAAVLPHMDLELERVLGMSPLEWRWLMGLIERFSAARVAAAALAAAGKQFPAAVSQLESSHGAVSSAEDGAAVLAKVGMLPLHSLSADKPSNITLSPQRIEILESRLSAASLEARGIEAPGFSDDDDALPSVEAVLMPGEAAMLHAGCSTGDAWLGVPAGAVAEPTRVCLAVKAARFERNALTRGPLVALRPHGLALLKRASFRIRVPGVDADAEPLILLHHPGILDAGDDTTQLTFVPSVRDTTVRSCAADGPGAAMLHCELDRFCIKTAALVGAASAGAVLALAMAGMQRLGSRSARHARTGDAVVGISAASLKTTPPSPVVAAIPPQCEPMDARALAPAEAAAGDTSARRAVTLSELDPAWRRVPAPRQNYDVMLSYRIDETGRRGDSSAFVLQRMLEERGLRTFLGELHVRSGEFWVTTLKAAIDDAAVFVALLLPSYGATKWTRREIHHADQRDKPLLPVWHSGPRPQPYVDFYVDDLQYVPINVERGFGEEGVPTQATLEDIATQTAEAVRLLCPELAR